MTQAGTFNRLALLAGLSGVASLVCFGAFNLSQWLSERFVGAPFLSLALGLTAGIVGIVALRSNSRQRAEKVCAWLGVFCGCLMILAWAGIMVLLAGAMMGHPM